MVRQYSYDPTRTVLGRPRPDPTIEPYTYDLNGVDQPRNELASSILWISLGSLAVIALVMRLCLTIRNFLRRINTMGSAPERQAFWTRDTEWWSWLKRHVLDAPLLAKRHNRELRLTRRLPLHMGTIPSRVHTILFGLYIASNIFYCTYLSYDKPNRYMVVAEFRGRTGHLAASNMIALVLLAGRNNPLIKMLGIDFDTYNLIHRAMGRMTALEVIMHTFAWFAAEASSATWAGVKARLADDTFLVAGLIGSCCMILIIFLSPSPFRHAFYETFLSIHIVLVALVLAAAWVHTSVAGLPQLPYIQVAVALWAVDRTVRLCRILYCNCSLRGGSAWTTATIEPLSGEVSRVTIYLPRRLDVKPGSHAYLRFAGLRSWESHPFSIAWVRHVTNGLPSSEKGDNSSQCTSLTFLISAKDGMTRRLYNAAQHHRSIHQPTPALSASSSSTSIAGRWAKDVPRLFVDNAFWSTYRIKAAFEGPYGGQHSIDSYGHVIMFLGSSGITHGMSYLDNLITITKPYTTSARRFVLVWIVRDQDAVSWVRDWLVELKRQEIMIEVEVHIHVTRHVSGVKDTLFDDREAMGKHVSGMHVFLHKGRPDIKAIMGDEVDHQLGAMCVNVCGPGGLGDDVREAVRGVQSRGSVDLVEESFTW